MKKSIKTAYLCWLVGGVFGLHHIYLGRYKHAFVYMITFGGFLIGFLWDIYKLPDYQKEVNEDDEEYMEMMKKQRVQLKAPVFMAGRFFVSIGVALGVSFAMSYALLKDPSGEFDPLVFAMRLITPFVVGVLVYVISTEGPVESSLRWSLFGSYAAFGVDWLRGAFAQPNYNFISSVLVSALFVNWNMKWDHDYGKKKKSFLKFVLFASIGCSFIFTCYTLCIVNHLKFQRDGRNVTLRDCFSESFNSDSEDLKRAKEAFKMLYAYYQTNGLYKLFILAYYGQDAEALENAYKVS